MSIKEYISKTYYNTHTGDDFITRNKIKKEIKMAEETKDNSAINDLVKSITQKLQLYAEGQKALTGKIDANAAEARQMNQEYNYKMTSFIKTTFEHMGERLDMKIDKLENTLTKRLENSDKIVMARVEHKLGGIQDNLKIRDN